MYVKYAEDWRLKQFQIFQAQQELQLQKVGQCLYLLGKNTHSLAWRKEIFRGTENTHKVSGGSVVHCDGIKSRRNMPPSLSAYRNTVFICDTGNKSVRMLMSAKVLIPLQKRFTFLNRHEHKALERTGKRNTNDLDLTIPRATRQSFLIVLESLTSLTNTMTEIGHEHLLDRICFESKTTLSV